MVSMFCPGRVIPLVHTGQKKAGIVICTIPAFAEYYYCVYWLFIKLCYREVARLSKSQVQKPVHELFQIPMASSRKQILKQLLRLPL